MAEKSINICCGALVLNDDEKALLVRLNKASELGERWSVPMNVVNYGEKAEDSLMNFMEKEYSVKIQILKVIGFIDEIKSSEHLHKIYFLCRIHKGNFNLKNNRNYTEFKWFDAKDVPEDSSINDVLLPLYILKYITVGDYNIRVDKIRSK